MGSTCTNCLNNKGIKPEAFIVNTSYEEDKENATICVIENIKESVGVGKTNTISIFQGKVEKELPQITILPQVQTFNTLKNYKCSNNIQNYIDMYHQRFLNRVISQTVKKNEDEDLDPVRLKLTSIIN